MFISDNMIGIRDEPARPSRFLTAHISDRWDDTNFKFIHSTFLSLKIVESSFEHDILNRFETIALLRMTAPAIFQTFSRMRYEPHCILKIWFYHMKVRHRSYQSQFMFDLRNIFIWYRNGSFGQINQFSPDSSSKLGWNGLRIAG